MGLGFHLIWAWNRVKIFIYVHILYHKGLFSSNETMLCIAHYPINIHSNLQGRITCQHSGPSFLFPSDMGHCSWSWLCHVKYVTGNYGYALVIYQCLAKMIFLNQSLWYQTHYKISDLHYFTPLTALSPWECMQYKKVVAKLVKVTYFISSKVRI